MRAIGLAGWSGAGKTTLIVRLIPELNRRGLSASTIKHAHHGFDVDRPGKDSYEHRAAGAHEVLVASANRLALMRELRGAPEPSLADLLRLLEPVDLVLIEGFKRDPFPKIEVYRAANGKPPLHPAGPKHRCAGQRLRRSVGSSAACVDRRHRRRGRSCAGACGAGCGRSRAAQAFLAIASAGQVARTPPIAPILCASPSAGSGLSRTTCPED